MEVDVRRRELGLAPDASLGELVAAAPAPWSGILADHREAFLTMTQEILAVAGSNRELLNRGQRAVRDALAVHRRTRSRHLHAHRPPLGPGQRRPCS